MGMFDTIEVHRKIPLKANDEVSAQEVKKLRQSVNWKEIEFQTKSLENVLYHYKIAVNGKLYVERVNYKEVDPKKYRGLAAKGNSLDKIPSLEVDGKPWFEPSPETPTSLIFYVNLKLSKAKEYWVEFEAIFLEGKLHEINQLFLERISKKSEKESAKIHKPQTQKTWLRNFFKKFIKWQEKILLGNK
tara:strand:+ start:706 stop:1269 length:564 start_codon:yes stop_codon:yes gene_type:complete